MDLKIKKITDLPEAETIEGLKTLGVDNTGKSVQVGIELLKGNKGDQGAQGIPGQDGNNLASKIIYNVSQTTGNYAYTDKQTARNAIPANLRGLGQILAYKLTTGWVNEQYIGTDISAWATEANWKLIGSENSGVLNISHLSNNYDLTLINALALIPEQSMKLGLIMSYTDRTLVIDATETNSEALHPWFKANYSLVYTNGTIKADTATDLIYMYPVIEGATYEISAETAWPAYFHTYASNASGTTHMRYINDSTARLVHTITIQPGEKFITFYARINGIDVSSSVKATSTVISQSHYIYNLNIYNYIGNLIDSAQIKNVANWVRLYSSRSINSPTPIIDISSQTSNTEMSLYEAVRAVRQTQRGINMHLSFSHYVEKDIRSYILPNLTFTHSNGYITTGQYTDIVYMYPVIEGFTYKITADVAFNPRIMGYAKIGKTEQYTSYLYSRNQKMHTEHYFTPSKHDNFISFYTRSTFAQIGLFDANPTLKIEAVPVANFLYQYKSDSLSDADFYNLNNWQRTIVDKNKQTIDKCKSKILKSILMISKALTYSASTQPLNLYPN